MKQATRKPQVQNWYKDRYQMVVTQRKLLVFITLSSLACTLLLALVITQLIPLKTIEPYVIQIDQKTGITQTVNPVTAAELTSNEAVNNYFIVQYVRSREGYVPSMVEHSYNLVRLMSDSSKVYGRFMEEADPNNNRSNIARFGSVGKREVKIKSITYLTPQQAQIRVLLQERFDNGINNADLNRIITLSFEYTKMSLSNEERYLNPLGFRVTDYQVNEDVLQ